MIEILSAVLILFGATFALIGSLGLVRFPDVFMRLHGPTKATTLGVGALLVGVIVYLVSQGFPGAIRELLITIFLFLTAPVSAHLLGKVALHRRCESVCDLPEDDQQ